MQNVLGVVPEVFKKCDLPEGNKFDSIPSQFNSQFKPNDSSLKKKTCLINIERFSWIKSGQLI